MEHNPFLTGLPKLKNKGYQGSIVFYHIKFIAYSLIISTLLAIIWEENLHVLTYVLLFVQLLDFARDQSNVELRWTRRRHLFGNTIQSH